MRPLHGGADEEAGEAFDEGEDDEDLPTFFEAIRPHMRRNVRGPGMAVGIEYLAKKFEQTEADLLEALKECGFTIPASAKDEPAYLEYDGDLYWLNLNHRGQLWINTREKPRAVFRPTKGQQVANRELPDEGPSGAAAAQPENQPAEGERSAPAEPARRPPAARARPRGGTAPIRTGAARPPAAGHAPQPARRGTLGQLQLSHARAPDRAGGAARPPWVRSASTCPGIPTTSPSLSTSATSCIGSIRTRAARSGSTPASGGGTRPRARRSRRLRSSRRPRQPSPRSAPPVPAVAAAPATGSPLAAVRLLLKETRRGGVAAGAGHLAGQLGRSPEDFLAALVEAGLQVPGKPREKPVFVEHAGEIFWLNRNARGELWLNAKAAKFAEQPEPEEGEPSAGAPAKEGEPAAKRRAPPGAGGRFQGTTDQSPGVAPPVSGDFAGDFRVAVMAGPRPRVRRASDGRHPIYDASWQFLLPAEAAAFLLGIHPPPTVRRFWPEDRCLAVRFGLNPAEAAATELLCS